MEFRFVRFTDRFDETCAFWGDVVGWPVTHEWPADDQQGRGRLFGFGNARVELVERADGTAVAPMTGAFLSIQVDDVQAVHDRVRAAGHPIESALALQPWGHRSFTTRDPAGASVVMFEVTTGH